MIVSTVPSLTFGVAAEGTVETMLVWGAPAPCAATVGTVASDNGSSAATAKVAHDFARMFSAP